VICLLHDCMIGYRLDYQMNEGTNEVRHHGVNN